MVCLSRMYLREKIDYISKIHNDYTPLKIFKGYQLSSIYKNPMIDIPAPECGGVAVSIIPDIKKVFSMLSELKYRNY